MKLSNPFTMEYSISLRIDHELNCLTAATLILDLLLLLLTCSYGSHCSSIWTANELVLRMLEKLDRLGVFGRMKQKEKAIFGLGHSIYKSYDLRAKIIRNISYE